MDTIDKRDRILWLDVARVLAILFVSFNHAINRTFDNYHNTMTDFQMLSLPLMVFKTTITVLSKLGVPLFLMITGALILHKRFESHEDVKYFYKHNLLRLFITTELWFVVIYLYKCLDAESILRLQGLWPAVKALVQTICFINPVSFDSMWYLPMILCVYLVLPFFALSIRKVGMNSLLLPMAVVVCSGMLIPNINMTRKLMGFTDELVFSLNWVNVFSFYVVFVLIGYAVSEGMLSGIKKTAVWATATVSFAACCFYQYWAYSQPGNILLDYNFLLLAVCAAACFELLRRHPFKQGRTALVISDIAVMAFAIYFVHICIMQGMSTVLNIHGYLPKFLILEVASVAGSILLIKIFSKNHFLKTYLFMIKE